jgi:hypothetical protein
MPLESASPATPCDVGCHVLCCEACDCDCHEGDA